MLGVLGSSRHHFEDEVVRVIQIEGEHHVLFRNRVDPFRLERKLVDDPVLTESRISEVISDVHHIHLFARAARRDGDRDVSFGEVDFNVLGPATRQQAGGVHGHVAQVIRTGRHHGLTGAARAAGGATEAGVSARGAATAAVAEVAPVTAGLRAAVDRLETSSPTARGGVVATGATGSGRRIRGRAAPGTAGQGSAEHQGQDAEVSQHCEPPFGCWPPLS